MTTTTRKPGRPPVPAGRIRKEQLHIYVLPEERDRLIASAALSDATSLSDWARRRLLNGTERK